MGFNSGFKELKTGIDGCFKEKNFNERLLQMCFAKHCT